MDKLEYINIDLNTASTEEIRFEIERLKYISNTFKNEEQAIKIQLNSVFGGISNKYLVAYNTDVAESITLQGQNLNITLPGTNGNIANITDGSGRTMGIVAVDVQAANGVIHVLNNVLVPDLN